MSSKRSAEGATIPASLSGGAHAGVDVVLSGGSAASMSGSKRVKTASTTTTSPPADANEADPIQSVLTNPDTLSKTLLCLNVEDIPSAARTCKVWNITLDSIQDKLWLGLVREHHPTLETIRSMLPDVGVGWKETFKRRRTVRAPDCNHPPSSKPLSSYVFEVIAQCNPLGGELGTIVKSAAFSDGRFLRLSPLDTSNGSSLVSVRIYDRFSGRQAVLLDRWQPTMYPYPGVDSQPVQNLVPCRSVNSDEVEVKLHTEPYLYMRSDEFVLDLYFSVHMNQEQGGRPYHRMGVSLAREQILDMIQNHLDWK